MAHEYSVDIHNWLNNQLDQVKASLETARIKGNTSDVHYFSGQLEALKELRQYLTDHIDLDTQQYY